MRVKKNTGRLYMWTFVILSGTALMVYNRLVFHGDAAAYDFVAYESSGDVSQSNTSSSLSIPYSRLKTKQLDEANESYEVSIENYGREQQSNTSVGIEIENSVSEGMNAYSNHHHQAIEGQIYEKIGSTNHSTSSSEWGIALSAVPPIMLPTTEPKEIVEEEKKTYASNIQAKLTAAKGDPVDKPMDVVYCDCDGNGPVDCQPDPNCDTPNEVPLDGHELILLLVGIGIALKKKNSYSITNFFK